MISRSLIARVTGCWLLVLATVGCSNGLTPAPVVDTAGLAMRIGPGLPAVDVPARGETEPVGTAHADAADDPAIWHNAKNPAASLIVGTDKKAGLYVYAMDGTVRGSSLTGRFNNVALAVRSDAIIVIASDRTDPLNSRLALFLLDGESAALAPLANVPSGPGEAYGVCVAPPPPTTAGSAFGASASATPRAVDTITVYAAIKDGSVRQITLTHQAGRVDHKMGASWKLATQIEGCVVDGRSGALFVGEEDVGIWKLDPLRPQQPPVLFAAADGQALVADVEGLALADNHPGSPYLVASSQGDNAYAVFDTGSGKLLGRFRINGGAIDGTSETDGIELATGDFGPGYDQGIFLAQDGDNGAGTQNFKLVSWAAIKAALQLR